MAHNQGPRCHQAAKQACHDRRKRRYKREGGRAQRSRKPPRPAFPTSGIDKARASPQKSEQKGWRGLVGLLKISPSPIDLIHPASGRVDVKCEKQNNRGPWPEGSGIKSFHERKERDGCGDNKTVGYERRRQRIRQ